MNSDEVNMKKRLIAIYLAVAMLILSTPVYAYETNGCTIVNTLTFVPYSGFGTTSRSHMSSAADVWNAEIDFTAISVSSSVHTDATGYYTQDSNNRIYRIDAGSGYAGVSHIWRNPVTKVVTECDINLNIYYSWANSAQPNCFDVYSIILHEFGHEMGLADLRDTTLYSYDTAVMWYQGQFNSEKRTLKQDDKNGISHIYN